MTTRIVTTFIHDCNQCPDAVIAPSGKLFCPHTIGCPTECPESGFLPDCKWDEYMSPDDDAFCTMGENPAL